MTTPIITLVREVVLDEPGATFDALTNAVVDRMEVEGWPKAERAAKEIIVLILVSELMRGALEDALAKSGNKYVPKITGADGWVTPAGRVGGLGALLPPVDEEAHGDDYDIVVGPIATVTRGKKKDRIVVPIEPGQALVDDFKGWLKAHGDLTQHYEAIGPMGLLAVDTSFGWHLKVIKRAVEDRAAA